MAYSVPSLPIQLFSGLPKPTENRSTLTPQRRATQKWPYSWKVTRMPRVTSNANIAISISIMLNPFVNQFLSVGSGKPVNFENNSQRVRFPTRDFS